MNIIQWRTSYIDGSDVTYHCLIKAEDDVFMPSKYNNAQLSCDSQEEYAEKLSSLIKDIILEND